MSGARMRGFPAGDQEAAGIIASWYAKTAGAHRWHKPPVDQPALAWVEILSWGAGGGGGCYFNGGGAATASGGEGGTGIRYVLPYLSCPSSIDFTNGAGGAGNSYTANAISAGTDGGDSQFTISGLTFLAKGGAGGVVSSGTQPSPLTDCSINGTSVAAYGPFFAGNGGASTSTVADDGDIAIDGAAGGGGAGHNTATAVAGAGGESINGGSGGDGAGSVAASAATAGAGKWPGGGGGGAVGKIGGNAATSGAGADGGAIVRIHRTRPSGTITNFGL